MKKIRAILTLIVTLTFVISPLLTAPFSGFRAEQLPFPQIDPPVQPAGYAFAIWGVIYAWLVVSAVFGLIKRPKNRKWNNVRLPLIVSLGVGTPWLMVANNSAILATVMIFIMAIAAIIAVYHAPRRDRWWLRAPVGIYAGWLTAASFVALASTAAGYGVLMGPLGWAYAGIIGALLVAAIVQRQTGAPGYGLTVIWALVGIIVANGTSEMGVSALAALGIGAMLMLTLRPSPNGRPDPF